MQWIFFQYHPDAVLGLKEQVKGHGKKAFWKKSGASSSIFGKQSFPNPPA
jgi:hypothetical protein